MICRQFSAEDAKKEVRNYKKWTKVSMEVNNNKYSNSYQITPQLNLTKISYHSPNHTKHT